MKYFNFDGHNHVGCHCFVEGKVSLQCPKKQCHKSMRTKGLTNNSDYDVEKMTFVCQTDKCLHLKHNFMFYVSCSDKYLHLKHNFMIYVSCIQTGI